MPRLLGPNFVVAALFVALSFPSPSSANPQGVSGQKVAHGAIQIDGSLNDPGWQEGRRIELSYEWFPGDNAEPPVATEVLFAYSESHLYLGWRCSDPDPSKVRAHLMDRDDIETFVQDDHVSVTIDTFNDQRRGYQFRVNPLGVQADAIFSETGGEDFSFDMIWKSAGRVDGDGYVVEMAIPFSQLRFARTTEPQTWGFDFQRSYPRRARHRISSWKRDRDNNCYLCQIDKIDGLVGMESGRNLEITPTLTASRSDQRDDFPSGPLVTGDETLDAGLSLRWGLTPSLTLNATVNPDFSQVEADSAQLNVNERFALFFEEKRPFFLEGADFFRTPIRAVFTRTIADPKWGLKLTGKEGPNALGVFAARDSINSFLIPGNQFSRSAFLDEDVDNGVLRYRRDLGESSTVGVLWAGREGSDYSNHVMGADAFLRFGPRNTLQLQFLGSETEYPAEISETFDQETGSFTGHDFLLGYNYDSRPWDAWFWVRDRGEGFRADLGFAPQADFRSLNTGLQRTIWGDGEGWLDEWNNFIRYERAETQDGQLTEESIEVASSIQGPLQSFTRLSVEYGREFFLGVLHEDLLELDLWFSVNPSGAVRLAIGLGIEDEIDLVNNVVGEQLTFNPGVEWKIGRKNNLQLDHRFERLEIPSVGPRPGGKLIEANLTQLRWVHNFNVRSFLRTILQHQALSRSPERFPSPVEASQQTLLAQLLYAYKINPQTVAFAGYSENRLGVGQISLTETGRTLFLKLGYAWAP